MDGGNLKRRPDDLEHLDHNFLAGAARLLVPLHVLVDFENQDLEGLLYGRSHRKSSQVSGDSE